MTGDDQKRFCSICKKHVYNIANMTEKEVEDVIFTTERQVCVRLYRRRDGLVMTRECGKWKSVKTKAILTLTPILALFGVALAMPVMGQTKPTPQQTMAWTRKELRILDEEIEREKEPLRLAKLQEQREDARKRLKLIGKRILQKK